MADNIELNAGSGGAIIAADDITSVWYQINKLAFGALGVATLVTSTSGLPVAQQGTWTVDLGATDNAVLDDIAAKLATIDADTSTLAAGVSTEYQVDIVSMPAVDTELTTADLDTGAGTDTRAVVGIAGTASGGAQLIPGSATDGLLVNLGANNDVTVTGTVDLGATDNAVLDAIAASVAAIDTDATTIIGHLDGVETLLGTIDADTSTLAGAVTGTEMQVDVVAALPTGANAIGKLAANSGIDIGDVDVTSIVPGTGATNLGKAEDAAHTTGDVGVGILGVRLDSPNAAQTTATAEYIYPTTDMVGGLRTALYETDFAVLGTKHVKKYYTSAGAATDGIIWSPAAGARWYVTDIYIQISAAATITLEDDLAGGDSPVWKGEFAANSGWSHSFATPLFSGEDAADLIITTSAGNVYVTVTGYEI